ncbi:hypothetical protein ATPR_1093 [Acetobacter tropicalis NBRC 101654]|uniref:Uncharacterized protein n=1 Tax=Acetobacter tropicalis NBRC 101654 TaxID=749388 RepID=F7VCJ4_9PROT|nr:hypothetical protein ATPR_1093 [Acetobacter tropicalis NBRC 101654]
MKNSSIYMNKSKHPSRPTAPYSKKGSNAAPLSHGVNGDPLALTVASSRSSSSTKKTAEFFTLPSPT